MKERVTSSDPVLEGVLDCLRSTLPRPPSDLNPATQILELEHVDSMVLSSLLFELESRFGTEVEPTLIKPANFETPNVLAELIRHSALPSTSYRGG